MPTILVNMPSQYAGRPSGVAWVVFSLLTELLKNSEFDYILRSPWRKDELPLGLASSRLSVVQVERPKQLVLNTLVQCITVPQFCRSRHVDLVFNVDAYGCPVGAKARVMVAHDLYFKTLSSMTSTKEKFITDLLWRVMTFGNRQIIAVSNATLKTLTASYPSTANRVTCIHSAATLSKNKGVGRQFEGLGAFVLAVGNNTYNKNYSFLVEGYKKMLIRNPHVKLVHVGNDPHKRFEAWLGADVSVENFRRFENLEANELISLYQTAACLCVTSKAEGFCLPILEAQRFGCAIVSSNNSAMPEIAGNGALLYESENLDDFQTKLQMVVNDPDIKDRLRIDGYINEEKFTWRKTAELYESVFKNLVSNSG